jgi:hypothetical protein
MRNILILLANYMAQILVPQNFSPRDYQLKLFQALDGVEGKPETKIRKALIRWCRRSGKDLACFAYMVKEAVRQPGVYYYLFPTYSQGEKALWEGMTKHGTKYLELIPSKLIKRQDNKKLRLELTNNSIIRVIGCEDLDTIVGPGPRGIVMSEYAVTNPEAYAYMSPMLSENDGWIIINSTPRGKDNQFYKLEEKIKDLDYWFNSEVQTLWPEKPNYYPVHSQENIQQEMEMGTDWDHICQEYGVSYTAGIKGAYYADQINRARAEERIGEFPYNPNVPVYTFWDLGRNDHTAIWFAQYVDSKIIFIDYYEERDKDLMHYVEVLYNKPYNNYASHGLPWDGVRKNQHSPYSTVNLLSTLLAANNVSGRVTKADKLPLQDGINSVKKRFHRYYFNYEKCFVGVEHLANYRKKWNKEVQAFSDTPIHDDASHGADALRTEALLSQQLDRFERQRVSQLQVISEFDPLA